VLVPGQASWLSGHRRVLSLPKPLRDSVAGLVGQQRTRLADYSGGTAADLHGLSFCPRLKFGVTAGTEFSKNNDS